MSDLVGISLCDHHPVNFIELDIHDKHCRFVGKARRKAFYIRSGNISFPLARFYLGIGETNMEELARTLVEWNDAVDTDAAYAYLKAGLRLENSPRYIAYFPYPTEDVKPDVLILIGDADEVQRLVQSFCARTGRRIKASLSGIGAACGECTAYPLVTEHANVSVGCNGSRPGINLKRGELLLAFPFDSEMAATVLRR